MTRRRGETVPFDAHDWQAATTELVAYACARHFGADEAGARAYVEYQVERMSLWAEETGEEKVKWTTFAKRWLLKDLHERPPRVRPPADLFAGSSPTSSGGYRSSGQSRLQAEREAAVLRIVSKK